MCCKCHHRRKRRHQDFPRQPGRCHPSDRRTQKMFRQDYSHEGTRACFLGMRICYTKENTAIISMKDYLDEAIAESVLDSSRSAATPATKSLFKVDKSSALLGKGQGETFHSVTDKLLYVSLCARPDIFLPIAFL